MPFRPIAGRARHARAGGRPARGLRRGAVRTLGAVAATVSCALLLISGYAWYSYTSLNRNLHTVRVTGLGGGTAAPAGAPRGGTGNLTSAS